jgi:5-methylcytosine-specific restriction protein A
LLAREKHIPILGILKDYATGRCSICDTFECEEVRDSVSGDSMWLRLKPARLLNVEVSKVDIAEITGIRRG